MTSVEEPSQKGFVWEEYLDESGLEAANDYIFNHVRVRDGGTPAVGAVVEVTSETGRSCWPARVTMVCGSLLRLRFVGSGGAKHDFWCDAQSGRLRPLGWGWQHHVELRAPPGVLPPDLGREQMLSDVLPPGDGDGPPGSDGAPPDVPDVEKIGEGMKLEVLDDANPYHVWTATVLERCGVRLRLRRDTLDDTPDLWLCASSPRVRHFGWASDTGAPFSYEPPTECAVDRTRDEWEAILEMSRDEARQMAVDASCLPHTKYEFPVKHSSVGCKLEAVHPDRSAICPATVVAVLDSYFFRVQIDNSTVSWLSSLHDPNILPQGWCRAHGLDCSGDDLLSSRACSPRQDAPSGGGGGGGAAGPSLASPSAAGAEGAGAPSPPEPPVGAECGGAPAARDAKAPTEDAGETAGDDVTTSDGGVRLPRDAQPSSGRPEAPVDGVPESVHGVNDVTTSDRDMSGISAPSHDEGDALVSAGDVSGAPVSSGDVSDVGTPSRGASGAPGSAIDASDVPAPGGGVSDVPAPDRDCRGVRSPRDGVSDASAPGGNKSDASAPGRGAREVPPRAGEADDSPGNVRAGDLAVWESAEEVGLVAGAALEVVHPETPGRLCAAAVQRTAGHLVWLRLLSLPGAPELIYPHNSDCLFPVEWASAHGATLLPPDGWQERQASSEGDQSSSETAAEVEPAGRSPGVESGATTWTGPLYVNTSCYSGPLLSLNKLVAQPRVVGPGPVRLVARELLTRLVGAGYQGSRVLKHLQRCGPARPGWTVDLLKAKVNNTIYGGVVELPSVRSQIEEFCASVSGRMMCCPGLVAPHRYTADTCPHGCRSAPRPPPASSRLAESSAAEGGPALLRERLGPAKRQRPDYLHAQLEPPVRRRRGRPPKWLQEASAARPATAPATPALYQVSLEKSPRLWDAADLGRYLSNTECAHLVDKLLQQEMDGVSFMLLTCSTLTDVLHMSRDDAMALCTHVSRIKYTYFTVFGD